MERISNEEKANEICKRHIFDSNHYDCCMEMARWKDEGVERENQELRHQIRLLIDAIDHAYLRLDGTYGDLSYEVSDQVKYVKSMQTKELEGRMKL